MAGSTLGAQSAHGLSVFIERRNGTEEGGTGHVEVSLGDPVDLIVTLRNTDGQPWAIEERELGRPESFVLTDPQGTTYRSTVHVGGPSFPVSSVVVPPGQERRFPVALQRLYPDEPDPGMGVASPWRPGGLSLKVVIRAPRDCYQPPQDGKWPEGLWPRELVSNPLQFRIGEPTPQQVRDMIARLPTLPATGRSQTVTRLGRLRSQEAVPAIARLAGSDPSPDVRVCSLLALGEIGAGGVAQSVEAVLLADGDTRVRAHAAELLGRLGQARSVPVLVESLRGRVPPPPEEARVNVWYAAVVRALGDIGDPRAIPALRELAGTEPVDWVRDAAKAAVHRIETQQAPTGR
jgi:hypothetical protein